MSTTQDIVRDVAKEMEAVKAIIDALKIIGPATARQIERHPDVSLACRQAKLKARHRLDSMMLAGRVKSDRVGQGAMFWV